MPGMSRAATFALTLLTLFPVAAAQDKTEVQKLKTGARASAEPRSKLTKEQQRQVKQLLESAEIGAAELDPASRVAALTELSQAYRVTNKAKAIELLETALTAVRNLAPNPSDSRAYQARLTVEQNAIHELASLAPERLDHMMDSIPPGSRVMALSFMFHYYDSTKQLNRAYELLLRTAGESEMHYQIASRLMQLLQREHPEQTRALFVSSLTSYQNHESDFDVVGDFPDMIIDFHQHLPDELVDEAIDAVLARAKRQDEKNGGLHVSMSSSTGAVSFQSIYDYRLFQLQPILQKIDPGRTEKLINERQDVKTLLAKYPEGESSLANGEHKAFSITRGTDTKSSSVSDLQPLSAIENQRIAQIIADGEKHPQTALANAALLSPMAVMELYLAIAKTNAEKDSTATRMALGKATDSIEKLPLEDQMLSISSVSSLYLQIGDKENAKAALEKGLVYVSRLYKRDTAAEERNTAPMEFWPSTSSMRAIVATAAKIDQRWAMSLLNDIPDDGVRVFVQITIAKSIQGAAQNGFVMMTPTKTALIGGEN
jgi:hypothetical protein